MHILFNTFNTFGAILGSFSAGFILMPLFGVRIAAIIAASLNIIVTLTMIGISRARLKGAVIVLISILFAAPLSAALLSQEEEWPVTYYVAQRYKDYQQLEEERKGSIVLLNKDYMEGRVKIWRNSDGFLILQVEGRLKAPPLWTW